MEIRTYFRILGRFWWVIVLATLAAGVGAFLLTRVREPIYTTDARFTILPVANIDNQSAVIDLVGQLGNRYIGGTYAKAVTSDQVVAESRAKVPELIVPAPGNPAPPTERDATHYEIEAVLEPDSLVVQVIGSGPDPQILTNYVNATVDTAISTTAGYFSVLQLQRTEVATVPEDPTSPIPARDIPIGLALGLAVGVLLALALDYLLAPTAAAKPADAEPEPESGFLRPPLRRVRQG